MELDQISLPADSAPRKSTTFKILAKQQAALSRGHGIEQTIPRYNLQLEHLTEYLLGIHKEYDFEITVST